MGRRQCPSQTTPPIGRGHSALQHYHTLAICCTSTSCTFGPRPAFPPNPNPNLGSIYGSIFQILFEARAK